VKKVCAIAVDKVPIVFDDMRLRKLAHVGKLPADADFDRFARSVRGAVQDYAHAARLPSSNDLHREIKALHRAACRTKYEEVADLLEGLSTATREWLEGRGKPLAWQWIHGDLGVKLPPADALRQSADRDEACALVRQLCAVGGQFTEGRRRWLRGNRSRTYRPQLCAPEPSPYFSKREAERDLIQSLQISYLGAAGEMPALTARHKTDGRPPGPFARMAQEILRLAGARADAVGLITKLNRRRRALEKRADQVGAP
jgi:hypothetical protein